MTRDPKAKFSLKQPKPSGFLGAVLGAEQSAVYLDSAQPELHTITDGNMINT